MKLTNAKVKALGKAGMHGDGRGLYLRVAAKGTKSWILRATVDGRRSDIGLGGFPAVSLAAARKAAEDCRATIAAGGNPLADRERARRQSSMPTFAEAAETVHALNMAAWKNGKHVDQWISTLRSYAFPIIGKMRLDRIERRDVLSILTGGKAPLWTTKPETGRRVRQRIRTVLKWAQAQGYVEHNAAGEAIDGALPRMKRFQSHFRALPYAEIPEALETVEASQASMASKLCLRLLILTAARSGEARGARWSEIDLDARLWTVPASRMKSGVVHRVPLSEAALEVLTEAARLRDDSDLLFPSPMKRGAPLSDMTLTKLLRDCGLADRATAHGFRSCFRDWASENTSAPHAVMERALAHVVADAVEAAYSRSDLLEKRRALLEQWGAFVTRPPGGAQVVHLHG